MWLARSIKAIPSLDYCLFGVLIILMANVKVAEEKGWAGLAAVHCQTALGDTKLYVCEANYN